MGIYAKEVKSPRAMGLVQNRLLLGHILPLSSKGLMRPKSMMTAPELGPKQWLLFVTFSCVLDSCTSTLSH